MKSYYYIHSLKSNQSQAPILALACPATSFTVIPMKYNLKNEVISMKYILIINTVKMNAVSPIGSKGTQANPLSWPWPALQHCLQ